jgi:hypothetical protein
VAESPSALLRRLEDLRFVYGADAAAQRLDLLRRLERRRCQSADEILRLHEQLCFLRAYPDDRAVLAQVERMLDRFAQRFDLARHSAELADTGIAGTEIYYRFYWVTADWLARHWPDNLSIDWVEFEQQERLFEILDLLLPYTETTGLDLVDYSLHQWIEHLKGPAETDAAFLIGRFQGLAAETPVRERLYEQLDVPLRLAPGDDTPSRTRAKLAGARVVFQTGPLAHGRPSLRREIARSPQSLRSVTARRGAELIDLAREAMATRSRDLDAFAHADARDARLATFERGLQFAILGLRPERRLMLETSYGMITLKNGVPMGYALASSLFRSTEVAYNVFDTFRGGEAAWVFARLLALVRHLFGSDTFSIDPYQLGHGNEEGLRSGAWWFYYKLGFRPRDPGVRRLVRTELARMQRNPRHRSSLATLDKLSAEYVFLHTGRPRKSVMGQVDLGNVGLRVSSYLAQHFGADREAGLEACSRQAAKLLGLRTFRGWSPGERLAWQRWSPLVLVLPGVAKWTRAEKRALIEIVRAKGARRESSFVRLFDAHPKLGRAMLRLTR